MEVKDAVIENQAPSDVAKATEFEIKISFPPEFTIDHWQAYSNGRADYIKKCGETGDNPDRLIGQYYGALALIKAGFVHVTGLDKLMEAVTAGNQRITSTQIMAFFVANVSNRAEAAIDYPLAWKVS